MGIFGIFVTLVASRVYGPFPKVLVISAIPLFIKFKTNSLQNNRRIPTRQQLIDLTFRHLVNFFALIPIQIPQLRLLMRVKSLIASEITVLSLYPNTYATFNTLIAAVSLDFQLVI